MVTVTIQNVATGNYLQHNCTQGATSANWNVVNRTTVDYMGTLRGSSLDVLLYLTRDANGNANLNTYCGNQELFTLTFASSVYTLVHFNSGYYLVANSDGTMGYSSTNPGDGSQTWTVTTGTGTGNVWQNSKYSTWLHSDPDGHTILNLTYSGTPSSVNLFNWTNSTSGSVYIQDSSVTTNYLQDSSGTVSVGTISSPPPNGFVWAYIPVGTNYAFQSYSGGYLNANSNGTSINETATGLYPGQLTNYALWTIS